MSGTITIFGASRSGTTILGMLLNGHPEITSVGELSNWFFNYNVHINRETHDPRYHPFFSKDNWGRGDPKRVLCSTCMNAGCTKWDHIRGLPSRSLYIRLRMLRRTAWLVDSSKESMYYDEILHDAGEERIIAIVIYKTVWGFVESIARRVYELEEGAHALNRQQRETAAKQWIGFYEGYKRLIEKYQLEAHHVAYEALALNPEKALAPVLKSMDLAWHPQMNNWASVEIHQIAGNPKPNQALRNLDSTICVDPAIHATPLSIRRELLAIPGVIETTRWLTGKSDVDTL